MAEQVPQLQKCLEAGVALIAEPHAGLVSVMSTGDLATQSKCGHHWPQCPGRVQFLDPVPSPSEN